ncbi:MAG: hypothetical protein K6E98_05715, partial [Lachnospiraceae bacterium]|nr:hypothetical protein [Lachnospiraceae bacterium]
MFRNVSTNNWSGQCEALTYQRAIRALENYGYDALIPKLGKCLFDALKEECRFVQQFDPFTGQISRVSLENEIDSYGPAMLSVLEYVSRIYGIHREGKELYWGCTNKAESIYEQSFGGNTYVLENSNQGSRGLMNGRELFSTKADAKLVTDVDGAVLRVIEI